MAEEMAPPPEGGEEGGGQNPLEVVTNMLQGLQQHLQSSGASERAQAIMAQMMELYDQLAAELQGGGPAPAQPGRPEMMG